MDKKDFLIRTKDGAFKVKIWWDKNDKVYLVKGLNLPDVITFGRTLFEAKKMAKEAVELYCECLIDEGKIIIDDSGRAIGRVPKSHVLQPVR